MRLIDADATIYALNVASRGDSKDVIRNLVICFLLASPTVDAVPVVRCKDCKYNPKTAMSFFDDDIIEGYIHCGHLGDEGFCSLGKERQ